MISNVRRTSIVTESIEQSKAFYCEGVGLEVFYDDIIESEASGKLMGIENPKVHLISLNSNDETTGMVGLMKFLRPDSYSAREEVKKKVAKTDIVLVFRSGDVESLYYHLKSLGYEPNTEPLEYEIPDRGRVRAISCYDPNGVLCEFTQYL